MGRRAQRRAEPAGAAARDRQRRGHRSGHRELPRRLGRDFIPNPRHGRKAATKLEAAQQALSRFPRRKAKDRTANHQRTVEKAAELHGKVRRQRLDHAHRTALGPVRAHDVIAHEDLRIRNMSKTPAPPNPDRAGLFLPNGVRREGRAQQVDQRRRLGVFLTIPHAKAESAGREAIAWTPATPPAPAPNAGTPPRRTGPHRKQCSFVAQS
nr:transposase [Streptomyces europaeiscabiei]